MTKQRKLRNLEYYDLQDCFDNLYAKSKENAVFTHLMEIISNEDNIKLAYRNIKRNAGSFTSGTDNKNIKDIEKLSAEKLIEIVRNKLNYYKPKPVRRVNIPKPNGKVRPLGIPCMIDRIVQQCVLQVLEPICEAKFHKRNNGFRPNRSTENAIAQCYKMIQQQNLFFVVDIDIKGFFDNVNHSKLIRQIWNIGIRDKRLICIIKQMLKSPVIMPDGSICYPDKGTPQGGLLSPLLANIVLNELDWWVSSQWENFSLHNKYTSKAYNYRVLRAKSKLKEMYIIRYADDFKIFCRNRNDADKAFHAVRLWLKDRLKLDISEEKSKVVNLKKRYSDFLGFKFKAVKKGSKYVVRAHMSDKAVKGETEKLKEKIKAIEHCKDLSDKVLLIKKYNSIVWGIHNYYRYATAVTLDCMDIQYQINRIVHNRLKQQVSRNGIIGRKYIFDRYGKSKMLRFICGEPLCPVGYVQTRNPMYKNSKVCKYTEEGRRFIHQNLKFDDFAITVLHMLANSVIPNRSIEYLDNRVSLYAAQYGKCAITGKPLWIDELHCHHKLPTSMGGDDKYSNLIIIHKEVHRLIHAVKPETIQAYFDIIKPNSEQLKKINKLRLTAGIAEI